MSRPEEIHQAIQHALIENRSRLLSFVKRRANGALDPEDILQRASERALTKSAQLKDATKAEAWVARIVRNTLVDELKKKRLLTTPLEESTLSTQPEEEGPCWCVLSQSTKLKPEYQEILFKAVLDEVPVRQVAEEIGVSANNAMVRLHRARQALRAQMKRHCGTTTARSCTECGCEERGCCPRPG